MTQQDPHHWEVSVAVNGENILTIGSTHLCGIENITDYHDQIRSCAEHLLAFIGERAAVDGEQGGGRDK